jgi:PKD repeat protein
MRAANDSFSNDSLFLQFSAATDSSGAPLARIGTTDALALVLEEGSSRGMSGWGWNDGDYGGLAAPIYFASSGSQTIRIQQREDGILWDQIVLTSAASATTRPGATLDDGIRLSTSFGTSAGAAPAHRYARAGVYPLTLTVTDNDGATASASATATIGAASALAADSRGPYSGTRGTAVSIGGSATGVPSGTSPAYAWTFGDDIVLRASEFNVIGSAWSRVADTSAAGGVAVSNADRGAAKIAAPATSPSSYVEATFRAAAGVPYRVWIRMRAANDSWSNDSVFLQFSGTTTSSGAAAWRIGTSDSLHVVLEESGGAGVSGWGWADTAYEAASQPVYFNQDGEQRIRIQQREDGVRIDQIVISANEYFDAAPGALTADRTILPTAATGATVSHVYPRVGVYPVVLKVTAGTATAEDRTTATIK